MRPLIQLNRSNVPLLDGLVAFWAVFWLVISVWVGYELWNLSALGQSLSDSGAALNTAGKALQAVGKVPVVGDVPGQLGDQVRQTAGEVVVRGAEAQVSMRRLSILLSLTIFLMPSTTVLAVYVPARLALRRES